MKNSVKAVALVGLFAALAFAAAGCGGGGKKAGGGNNTTTSGGGNVTALPASSCSSIYFEGSGSPDFIVASDLHTKATL